MYFLQIESLSLFILINKGLIQSWTSEFHVTCFHLSKENNNLLCRYIIRPKLNDGIEECRPSTSTSVSPFRISSHEKSHQFENEQPPMIRTSEKNGAMNQVAFYQICEKKLLCNYNHLQRHFHSNTHKLKENSIKSTPKISQFVNPIKINFNNSIKAAQLKLLMFLHKHNLQFSLMDHLPTVIASAFSESIIAKNIDIG